MERATGASRSPQPGIERESVGRAQARRFSTPAQYVTDAKPLPHPIAGRNSRPSSSWHQHQRRQHHQRNREQHRRVGSWPTIAPHWQAVQCINVITGRCIEHSSDHTVVGQEPTLLARVLHQLPRGRMARSAFAPNAEMKKIGGMQAKWGQIYFPRRWKMNLTSFSCRDSPTRKTDILLYRRSPKIKDDTEPPLTFLQHARLQTLVDTRRHLLLHGQPARTKGKRSARAKNRSLPARRRGHCTMAALPDRCMGGSARTPALHRDAPVR